METITGRVVSFDDITIHTRKALGDIRKLPYIKMTVRAYDGLFELLLPADSTIRSNVNIGDIVLAQATFVALTVGTVGMYKLHSYRRINAN
jgi:hypothetical protein